VPNEAGVRLESMVLVTKAGGEVLTRLKKDLIEV
jgi:Xaa-Pro aminopeptidase